MNGSARLDRSRGLLAPCTPRQGDSPCTHPATHRLKRQTCYRMILKEWKDTHGRYENKEKAEEKASFFLRLFLLFSPDAFGIRPAVEHRQPVGWRMAVPPSTCNITIVFYKRVSAYYKPQRDNVWYISRLLPLPGPGAMPLVGCRGETPHRSPQAPAGNCLFDNSTTSATGSRANGPCGSRGDAPGETPHRLPTPQRDIVCAISPPLPLPGQGPMALVGPGTMSLVVIRALFSGLHRR